MKSFLKYIYKRCWVVVVLIIIIIPSNFIIVNLSPFFLSDYKFHRYEDFEIGFFGHSEMKDAVNEDMLSDGLNKKTKNFSIRGAPLYYTSNLINYVLSKKEMTIIVNLSRNNVDYKGTLKNLFTEPHKDFYYSKFFYYHSLNGEPFLNNFLYGLFNLSDRINPFIHFKTGEKQEIKIHEAIKRFKKDSTEINKKWESNKIDIDYEIDEFDKLIKLHPEIEFILITTPEYHMNKILFDNNDRFNTVIKRLSENKNVEYLDYSNYLLEERFFRDYNHLSYLGKEVFSKILSCDLSLILD